MKVLITVSNRSASTRPISRRMADSEGHPRFTLKHSGDLDGQVSDPFSDRDE